MLEKRNPDDDSQQACGKSANNCNNDDHANHVLLSQGES